MGREEDKVEGEKKEEARAEKEEERVEEVEVVEPIPDPCWTMGKGCDHRDGSKEKGKSIKDSLETLEVPDVVLDRC